ncbi:MAG: RNA methyltransferase [Mycoplasma sp.]|nr:RNA methyltransferase [Mycoplasma sp.]
MREIITSTENLRVKKWKKLLSKKGRKEFNQFLIEGKNSIKEAMSAGFVKEIITTNENYEGILVTPAIIKKITGSENPQDIVAVCSLPTEKPIKDRILVLRNIQDPGNVGTLIRTAKSFGFSDVIVQGADPYSDKSLRSSQGAIFHINIIYTKEAINYIKELPNIIATLLDKKAKPFNKLKPKEPFALVMGNEGKGIDLEIKKICTEKIYIPINFESLNVAVAGGIIMNEYKKIEN